MRFRHDEADNYEVKSSGGGYFSLKNDKDTAHVRFMYNTIDDIVGDTVHEIEVDGRKRYVSCLRAYNSPIDDCPFCREHMPTKTKVFVPLYNLDERKAQVWERGTKFIQQISGICARYASNNDLVAQEFEIERNGKPRDTATTYGIYPVGSPDGTTLEDLGDMPKILGGVILEKSYEDMEYFLEDGQFPPEESGVQRRGARVDRSSEPYNSRERNVGRRTPGNRGREY